MLTAAAASMRNCYFLPTEVCALLLVVVWYLCAAAAVEDAVKTLKGGDQLGVGAWSETVSAAWRARCNTLVHNCSVSRMHVSRPVGTTKSLRLFQF